MIQQYLQHRSGFGRAICASVILLSSLTNGRYVAAESPGAPKTQNASQRMIEWVQQEGGSKHDKIRGITVDASGNCYVTGEFTDEANFAGRTLKSRGSMDFVLAKYSPDGKLLWLQTAGGTEIDRGYSVAVDTKGNSYVTGHFQSFRLATAHSQTVATTTTSSRSLTPMANSNGHTVVAAQGMTTDTALR